MPKLGRVINPVNATAAVLIAAVGIGACALLDSKPKFADAADLICAGLEDFEHLHNEVLSIHMLMEKGDYVGALQVADALLQSIDESRDVEGVRELRALIFLLQSLAKGIKQ